MVPVRFNQAWQPAQYQIDPWFSVIRSIRFLNYCSRMANIKYARIMRGASIKDIYIVTIRNAKRKLSIELFDGFGGFVHTGNKINKNKKENSYQDLVRELK